MKVWGLDIELDNGGRVVLSILKSGDLSIQTYRSCLRGRSLWRLEASAIVGQADLAEWSATLCEALLAGAANSRKQPLTAHEKGEKTASAEVTKKRKEIAAGMRHNGILSDV